MKSNIYTIKEPNNPTSTSGNGDKGLIIVIDQGNMDQNIQTLQGLVKAIKFDIEKDVSSVNGAEDEWNYKLTFAHPPKENKPTSLG